MGSLSTRNKKLLVPALMFIAALLALLALEVTRSDAVFNRGSFQNSDAYSAEAAITIGTDRPASLFLPTDYASENPVPLLINLHGYSGESQAHSMYTFMQSAADLRGVAYIAPNGLQDSTGNRFWNASDACCNFAGSAVSDVDYISSLIQEISNKVSIDQSRIYLFGHSNGHFMSYKFACSTQGSVTAIAGLAGAMATDPAACGDEPMNVLHIHGTSDATISFDGGNLLGTPYPSAGESVGQWASINSCSAAGESKIDLLQSMPKAETTQISYSCKQGSLEMWRINGGFHVPTLDQGFALRTLDWLLTHRK